MKKLTHISTIAALAAALMFSQSAFAQGGGDGANNGGNTGTQTEERRDDGPDLGWLGLLGLAGLAGLRKKPEQHVVHQTDVRPNPNTPTR